MSKVSIIFSEGFEYCKMEDIDCAHWIYKGEVIQGDELLNELNNNKLINGNRVFIPAGTYEVSQLHENDWTFIVNDFEMCVLPGLEYKNPIRYTLKYN